MTTKLNALDSSASDSFEIDLTPDQAATSPESTSIETGDTPTPEDLSVPEGDDWFDEGGATPEILEQEDPSISEEGESQEQEESSEESQAEAQFEKVSIDAFKKEHEFTLDPEDAMLRRTLRRGLKAPKFKEELDKVRAENTTLTTTIGEQKEGVEVWNEIREHMEAGQYERVFRAIAGEQFDEFLEGRINRRVEYMEADPVRRSEMDREDSDERVNFAHSQKDKRIKELEDRDVQRSEEAQLEKFMGYATPALEKVKFNSDEIEDGDVRNRLNKRLWRNAWDELDLLQEAGTPITPRVIHQTFTSESKLLKAGIKRAVKNKTKEVNTKQAEAAQEMAANIATSKYPAKKGSVNEAISDWNGKSAKDLLKFFK